MKEKFEINQYDLSELLEGEVNSCHVIEDEDSEFNNCIFIEYTGQHAWCYVYLEYFGEQNFFVVDSGDNNIFAGETISVDELLDCIYGA